jgi:hypothetical protein
MMMAERKASEKEEDSILASNFTFPKYRLTI